MAVVDGNDRCGIPEHSLLPGSQDKCQASAGAVTHGVVVLDQCASYHWLDPTTASILPGPCPAQSARDGGLWRWRPDSYLGRRLVVLFRRYFARSLPLRVGADWRTGLGSDGCKRLRRSIQVQVLTQGA